jgi:3-isopropylmalate dehydrogenase
MLSAAMLLGWLGRRHGRENFGAAEQAIEAAVDAAIRDPRRRTRDLGGTLGTRAFARTICEELAR